MPGNISRLFFEGLLSQEEPLSLQQLDQLRIGFREIPDDLVRALTEKIQAANAALQDVLQGGGLPVEEATLADPSFDLLRETQQTASATMVRLVSGMLTSQPEVTNALFGEPSASLRGALEFIGPDSFPSTALAAFVNAETLEMAEAAGFISDPEAGIIDDLSQEVSGFIESHIIDAFLEAFSLKSNTTEEWKPRTVSFNGFPLEVELDGNQLILSATSENAPDPRKLFAHLRDSLSDHKKLDGFPAHLENVIRTVEARGSDGRVLLKVAVHYDERLNISPIALPPILTILPISDVDFQKAYMDGLPLPDGSAIDTDVPGLRATVVQRTPLASAPDVAVFVPDPNSPLLPVLRQFADMAATGSFSSNDWNQILSAPQPPDESVILRLGIRLSQFADKFDEAANELWAWVKKDFGARLPEGERLAEALRGVWASADKEYHAEAAALLVHSLWPDLPDSDRLAHGIRTFAPQAADLLRRHHAISKAQGELFAEWVSALELEAKKPSNKNSGQVDGREFKVMAHGTPISEIELQFANAPKLDRLRLRSKREAHIQAPLIVQDEQNLHLIRRALAAFRKQSVIEERSFDETGRSVAHANGADRIGTASTVTSNGKPGNGIPYASLQPILGGLPAPASTSVRVLTPVPQNLEPQVQGMIARARLAPVSRPSFRRRDAHRLWRPHHRKNHSALRAHAAVLRRRQSTAALMRQTRLWGAAPSAYRATTSLGLRR